jgi:hypothetical protein
MSGVVSLKTASTNIHTSDFISKPAIMNNSSETTNRAKE